MKSTCLVGVCVFSLLSARAFGIATISFQGGTVRLTHTPDSTNGAIRSSQGPVTGIPVPSDRLNSGGYSLDGTNSFVNATSTGKAKVGHITNTTTTSFALRSGTGVTQTDPTNNYAGFSRTAVEIMTPLTWQLSTEKLFPTFSRYASFTVAGNVGTGGFARFTANLAFTNSAGTSLGSISLTTGTITTPGAFSRTLTAAGPLNNLVNLSGDQIRITGSVLFDASNDEAPTQLNLVDGEVGGNEGNTFLYAGGTRTWGNTSSWTNSTGTLLAPNSTSDHLVFAGSGAAPIDVFDSVNLAAGSSQAFGTIDVSGVNKIVEINGLSGSTLSTGASTLNRPNLRTQPGAQLRINRPLTVIGNGINIATEGNSSISLNQNPVLSAGTGSLNIAKTGAGTLILPSTASATPLSLHVNEGLLDIPASGVVASLDAQPADGQSCTINVNRSITLTGIHAYDRATVRIQRFGSSAPNIFQGGDLFIEDGGVLDITNSAMELRQPTGTLDPYSLFRRYIRDGYANGAWNGDGILSSTAAADPAHRTGIGYRRSVAPASGLIAYTLYGDADVSGSVNLADFTALAANFGNPGDWEQGDFNYDGTVDLPDFTRLASNFGATVPAEMPLINVVPESNWPFLALLAALGCRRVKTGKPRPVYQDCSSLNLF